MGAGALQCRQRGRPGRWRERERDRPNHRVSGRVRRPPVYSRAPHRVKDVLELLAAGATQEEILANYPYLEADDITGVVEFAARPSDPTR